MAQKRRTWSKKELKAAVVAYIDMRRKEAKNLSFKKTDYYAKLASKFGRTEKAFEYRMQNISNVYSLMGRNWVSGLKPAKNVGTRVAATLEGLINKVEGQKSTPVAAFQTKVNSIIKNKYTSKPKGNKKPRKRTTQVTQYLRDPEVVAWVLNKASGICECCGGNAPFSKEDGSLFLEVHHLRRLADDGSDTTTNAAAVCPNCHRELHLGSSRTSKLKSIYQKVGRLIAE